MLVFNTNLCNRLKSKSQIFVLVSICSFIIIYLNIYSNTSQNLSRDMIID
ncbi:unnamed protein product, partial [Arabidopsis halleri]